MGYGLECKWQKFTSPAMCTTKDWIPVCAEYNGMKKNCKKLGCDWDKVSKTCSGNEVCLEEDKTWGEVAGVDNTDGKIKTTNIGTVEECQAIADAMNAAAFVYEQFHRNYLNLSEFLSTFIFSYFCN